MERRGRPRRSVFVLTPLARRPRRTRNAGHGRSDEAPTLGAVADSPFQVPPDRRPGGAWAGAPVKGAAGAQAFDSARASGSGRPPVRFAAPGAPPAREVPPDLAASVSRVSCRERNGLRRYGLTIRVLPLKSQTRNWEHPRNRAR